MPIDNKGQLWTDGIEHDSETGRYSICHDWKLDSSISTSVIEAVATVSGRESTEIDPLYETIDPEGLDQLVTSLREAGEGTVTFDFAGLIVTVESDGQMEFRAAD